MAIANSNRNAVFVSIHFNATGRSGASGIETYFYSRDSLPLASAIHHYVAGGAPSDNRGVRRRGYYVLRKTNIPAVLVECGFLTNPTEAGYAQNASYRQKLAEEIAAGVRRRNSVGRGFGTTRVATAESIPLQPYIDQTKVIEIFKAAVEAFGQEKRPKKEDFIKTGRLRSARRRHRIGRADWTCQF